jgi:CBS domain-containing protein
MRAQDLMTQPIAICDVNDTLDIAAKKMWDFDCGVIAVVREDGKLAGMITDRDIAMAAYTQGRPLHDLLVNTAMAKHPVAVRPEHRLAEIEQIMAEHQVHRVPVVDADNKPIGVISLTDLVIESVQPDTKMTNGPSTIAHLHAAICRRHSSKERAA